MNNSRILMVDDDQEILESNQMLLCDAYEIDTADSVALAKEKISSNQYGAIIIDLNFEGQTEDGIDLIDFIGEEHPFLPMVVLSGDANTKRVAEAARRRLVDFVAKDGDHEMELRMAIDNALAKHKDYQTARNSEASFKTQSPTMIKLLNNLDHLLESNSSASILILGESGTGKEYMAKYISKRLKRPMIATNMANLNKDMAESELFGHTKGAFTGAQSEKMGLIEKANNGIFFLDEIGELSLPLQAKLLRVIQEKEICPIGSTTSRKLDVRFVAATNRDLAKMVSNNTFRLDLYERLNTFTFQIPALRDRPEDIAYYTRIFLEELTDDGFFRVNPDGIDELKQHSWRGNVRELRNIIERITVFSQKKILNAQVVRNIFQEAPANPYDDMEQEKLSRPLTRNDLLEALKNNNGNKTRAAKDLGVHITTFRRWATRFGVSDLIATTNGRPRMEICFEGGAECTN